MISGQQAALEPNALGSALIILLTTSTNSREKIFTHQSCKLVKENKFFPSIIDHWLETCKKSILV